MEENLLKIGLSLKEAKIYLYLVEYGISGASEIGKKLNIPKSSVNFIADNLWKNGFLKKTFSSNTGLYEADISLIEHKIKKDIEEKSNFIKDIIPDLKEKNKNVIKKPKIKFFDGLESCKNAYLDVLKTKESFLEFGAHKDLEEAFSSKFMDNFIKTRIEKNIFCYSIGTSGEVELNLQRLDKIQNRELKLFTKDFGEISSSIVIYDENVLILNLKGSYNGVLIENKDFSKTLRTIFQICKSS